jgi:hypothetical protein
MPVSLTDIATQLRAHPVAAMVELGSLLVCLLVFVATIGLLASGPPTGVGWPWLAVAALSASFVLFWTVLIPVYERTLQ